MVVSENGYGKRSDIEDYRVTNRGGKGVKTINVTDKTGMLIAIKDVTDNDDLMIINRSGIIIRMAVADLRVVGRATQGVRLIKIAENDAIAAVTKVEMDNMENGNGNGNGDGYDDAVTGENAGDEPVNDVENTGNTDITE